MGLEKIKEEVRSKAKARERELRDAAKREERKILRNAEAEAKAQDAAAAEEVAGMGSDTVARAVATAELEAQKEMLVLKKELLDRVFAEARKRVGRLPEAQRKAHIRALLEKAKKEIRVARVFCNERDLKFVEGAEARPEQMLGGLMAETGDENVRIDYRYDEFLERLREEMAGELAKRLFKK